MAYLDRTRNCTEVKGEVDMGEQADNEGCIIEALSTKVTEV